jgi:branched-subunit amino acid aminotransferase/4-amino-4-deoxychorismate lyase
MITTILVNGEPSDGRIEVFDSSVLRGDGCFEVLRSYGGRPFCLDDHLDRLTVSADRLEIELPPRQELAEWIETVSAEVGDGAVRVVVTRGPALPWSEPDPKVIVFAHPWERPDRPARLLPVRAPWHASGEDWELAGAKLLSYAPNLAASRRAHREGFDDALLLTIEGRVLEGPTFSVAWVVDGVLETPSLDLGILGSITRRVVLEDALGLGMEVEEGVWGLERLEEASEVMALSTIREVQAVEAVGGLRFEPGPVTARLADAFARRT